MTTAGLGTFRLTDSSEVDISVGYFQTLPLTLALTSEDYKRVHFINTSWNKTSWITRALKINVFLVKHQLRTIAKQELMRRSDVWEAQTSEQNVLDNSNVKRLRKPPSQHVYALTFE
jgi:hypothetical protein